LPEFNYLVFFKLKLLSQRKHIASPLQNSSVNAVKSNATFIVILVRRTSQELLNVQTGGAQGCFNVSGPDV